MEQMQPQDAAQTGAEYQAIQAAQAAQAAAEAAGQAAAQAAQAAQVAGQAAQAAGNAVQQAQGMAAQQAAQTDQSGMFGQGIPEGTQPKFDQNKFGEMMGLVSDAMSGDVKPEKLLGIMSDSGTDFWKGALVGAAAVFLFNNEAVKETVSGAFGSMFGAEDETATGADKE